MDTEAESTWISPAIRSLSPACGAYGFSNCKAKGVAAAALAPQADRNTRTNSKDKIRLKCFIFSPSFSREVTMQLPRLFPGFEERRGVFFSILRAFLHCVPGSVRYTGAVPQRTLIKLIPAH